MYRSCFMRQLLATTSSILLLTGIGALAQNPNTEFQSGFPVAPTGLDRLPLEDGPWDFRTGEAMNIHVQLVTRMAYPMALEFMPDDSLLVVTRQAKLYHLINDQVREITGGPDGVFIGESGGIGTIHGYMDVVLHPDFDDNQLIYILYHQPKEEMPAGVLTAGRGRLNGDQLEDFEIILDTGDLNGAGRLLFGPDGKLYMTTPDRDSQNLGSLGGKVLRLNDDGSIPADNPFADDAHARAEIWSYGHRYSLGLTLHPGTGELWQSENGPNGGDEVNIISKGADYGWPAASFGRNYSGPWQSGTPDHSGYQMPEVIWIPSVAVAGMTFYTGDTLSKWKGDLFIGALREGEVNGTGHLERILFNDEMQELRRESLLTTLHKRIRDVVQGPDGFLYLALEDQDGGILRVMPQELGQ